MVLPGAEDERNPDPPDTQQREAKQDAKTLFAAAPFVSYESLYFSFFGVGVRERVEFLRCV